MNQKHPNEYKLVISELGSDPFRTLDSIFVLMSLIPLLTLFYLINNEDLLQRIFLGNGGFIAALAIFISLTGFLYAYILIRRLVEKLLKYAQERRVADGERTEILLAVSHDLKNPLTVVRGSLDNLLEGVGGPLNEAHAASIRLCLSNVAKLSRFIEEISSASKEDFIRTFLKRGLADLRGIVEDEVNDFMPLAKKANVDLRYQVSPGNFDLWGDEGKLTRVVMNLISNAVKYTPTGGIIEVALFSDPDTVTLLVKNTSSGILSTEMDKIFKKYGRLEKHARIEGTGLGLPIIKDIVDLHNGHITVDAGHGKNIEFKVVLPRNLRGKTS